MNVMKHRQAAIVQGAALRGLEGIRSTTRLCRRHYGFSWSVLFRNGYDDESDAWIDEYDGQKRVQGIMKWMIAKVRINMTDTVGTRVILIDLPG